MLCFLEILEEATINDQTLEGCFVVEFYIEVCHSHSQLIMNWQNVANLTTWNGERITANEEEAETTNFNISQSREFRVPLL